MKAERRRAPCAACGRRMALDDDGRVWKHRASDERGRPYRGCGAPLCSGSWKPPARPGPRARLEPLARIRAAAVEGAGLQLDADEVRRLALADWTCGRCEAWRPTTGLDGWCGPHGPGYRTCPVGSCPDFFLKIP